MRPRSLAVMVSVAALTTSCAGAGGNGAAKAPAPATAAAPVEPDGKSLTAFAMKQSDLFGCYTSPLQAGAYKKGKTVLQFTILPDGGVEGVKVVESTIENARIDACMVDAVSRWKTPFRPAAPRTIRYPVIIS